MGTVACRRDLGWLSTTIVEFLGQFQAVNEIHIVFDVLDIYEGAPRGPSGPVGFVSRGTSFHRRLIFSCWRIRRLTC